MVPPPESSNETRAPVSAAPAALPVEQATLLAWYDFETLSATGPGFLNVAPADLPAPDHADLFKVAGDGLYTRAGLSTGGVLPDSLCFCSATAKISASIQVTTEEDPSPPLSISFWVKLSTPQDFEGGVRDPSKWVSLISFGTLELGIVGDKMTVRDRDSIFHQGYSDGQWVNIVLVIVDQQLDVYVDGTQSLQLPLGPTQGPMWSDNGVLEILNPHAKKHNTYLDEMRVYRGVLTHNAIQILADPSRYAAEDPYMAEPLPLALSPIMFQTSDTGPHQLEPHFKQPSSNASLEYSWKLLAETNGVELILDSPLRARINVLDKQTAVGEHQVLFSSRNLHTGVTFTRQTKVVVLAPMAKPPGKPYIRPVPKTNPVVVGQPIQPVAFWDFKSDTASTTKTVHDQAQKFNFSLDNTFGEILPDGGPGGRSCLKLERAETGGDYLRNHCVKLPSLPLGDEFSLSFWLYTDGDFNRRGIISQDDQGKHSEVQGIEMLLWSHVLRVYMRCSGEPGEPKAVARIRSAHWTHYTCVFGKEGQCRVYRNGFSDFTRYDGFGSCLFSSKPDGSLPFHLGISYGESRFNIKSSPMRISDLAFFDVALNSDEAQQVFTDGPLSLTGRLDGFAPFPNRFPRTEDDVWYSKKAWKEMCPKHVSEEITEAYQSFPACNTESKLFGELPAPYVHPRLAFGLDDLSRIRQNLVTTPLGKANYFHLLLLTNHGKQISGFLDVPFASEKEGSGYVDLAKEGHSAVQVQESLRILIQCDTAAAAHAIPVFIKSCETITRKLLEYERPENSKVFTFQDVHAGVHNGTVALIYDFLYPFMTEDDRQVARRSLQLCTQNFWVYGLGSPYQYTFNWVSFGINLGILCMAIEDEDGYDATTAKLCRESYNRHMTTYYDPTTGGCLEGELKTAFGTNFVPFYARREKHAATEFRGLENFFEKFVPSVYHPNGKLAIAGSGTLTNNGVIQGKWDARSMLYSEFLMAGYAYPNSQPIKQMVGLLSGRDLIGGLERAIGPTAWSPLTVTNVCFLPPKIPIDGLGSLFWKRNAECPNSAAPLALFCSERGLFSARSNLSRDALFLYSEFSMEERGHVYLHSGAFSIVSNQITWIQRYSEEAENLFGLFVVGRDSDGEEKLTGQSSLNPCFICDIEDQNESFSSISGDLRCKYIAGIRCHPHQSWFGRPDEIRSLQKDPRRDLIFWREHNKPGPVDDRRELQMYETGNENKCDWKPEDVQYPPAILSGLPDLPKTAFRTIALVRGKRPMVLVCHDHQLAQAETYHLRLPLDSAVYMDGPTSIKSPGIEVHEEFQKGLGQPALVLRQGLDPECPKRMLILVLNDPTTSSLTYTGGFVKANTVTGSTPHARWTYGLDCRTTEPVSSLQLRLCFIPFDAADGPTAVQANRAEQRVSISWGNGDKQSFTFGDQGPFGSTDIAIEATGAAPAVVNRGAAKLKK